MENHQIWLQRMLPNISSAQTTQANPIVFTIGLKTNTKIKNTLKSEDLLKFQECFPFLYLEGLLEHLYVHTENFQGENWTISARLLLGSLLIFSHVSHSSLAAILPILLLFCQENESQKCCISARFPAICTCACFFEFLSQLLSFSCNFYSIFELHILSTPKF